MSELWSLLENNYDQLIFHLTVWHQYRLNCPFYKDHVKFGADAHQWIKHIGLKKDKL